MSSFFRGPRRKEIGGKEATETMNKMLVFNIYEKSRRFKSIHTCVLEQLSFPWGIGLNLKNSNGV